MTTPSKRLEGHQLKHGPEQRPAQVVGNALRGFGVWIDGEFHRVDRGALGTAIVKLAEELRRLARNSWSSVRRRNLHNKPETCRPVVFGMSGTTCSWKTDQKGGEDEISEYHSDAIGNRRTWYCSIVCWGYERPGDLKYRFRLWPPRTAVRSTRPCTRDW